MTSFKVLAEGYVTQTQAEGTRTAVCSRVAVASNGELVCSYMTTTGSGNNDLVPMLSRSIDGINWTEQGPIWSNLSETYSLFCSISKAPNGDLFLYGFRTPIAHPAEVFWQASNHGMKKNELFWAKSTDHGWSWTDPEVIHTTFNGSHEAPGAMFITNEKEWLAVFAPYNTFDENLSIERNRIILVKSVDEGKSWKTTNMLNFASTDAGGAEAWVVQLGNGHLFGTSWNFDYETAKDYPNAYAISTDKGETWSPTYSTGIMGQSTALAAYGEDSALFLYNQRKAAEPGIGLVLVKPAADRFEILCNQLIWKAQMNTKSSKDEIDHSDWTDFAFGEPGITVLPDGSLLVVFWFNQAGHAGIQFVKLAII